jgi:CDP-diacylglycerol--inositol 3-phosphatidyltransferase
MYATLVMGGKEGSHKKVDSSRSRILHLYYTNKAGFLGVCSLSCG